MKVEPSICPICHGDGKRRCGKIVNDEETCHACDGKGIVWPPSASEPQTVPVPVPYPVPVPSPYAPPWNPIWPPRVWCTTTVSTGPRAEIQTWKTPWGADCGSASVTGDNDSFAFNAAQPVKMNVHIGGKVLTSISTLGAKV